MITKHIDVTPEQAAQLADSRHVAKEMDNSLAKSVNMVKELRSRLKQGNNDLDAEFAKLSKILTPSQVAKFVIWNCNNHACMHMLNELWKNQHVLGRSDVKKIAEFENGNGEGNDDSDSDNSNSSSDGDRDRGLTKRRKGN